MKGIVHVGGYCKRLYAFLKGVSFRLPPFYDKPMAYYRIV